MPSANEIRARAYLQAIEALGSPESVSQFYTPDVIIQEFPSRIAPNGRIRKGAELGPAYELGRKLLKSQTYDIKRIVESGDELAIELEWTGILAIPAMNLPAGSEMKAFVAIFLTFRDGKIAMQRSYDCYPPFGGTSDPYPANPS